MLQKFYILKLEFLRLSYENEKAREQVERHKRRLSELIKQQQQLAHNITINNSTPSDTKEEEEEAGNPSELQLLADERLKELQELQARFEHCVKVYYIIIFMSLLYYYFIGKTIWTVIRVTLGLLRC